MKTLPRSRRGQVAQALGLAVLLFWLAQPVIGVMCVAPTILYMIYMEGK